MKLYQANQAEQQAASGQANDNKKKDDGTVEGDFEEVDDDK